MKGQVCPVNIETTKAVNSMDASINRNFIIILSCLIVILAGCDQHPETGIKPANITIAAYSGDVSALVYLAMERGVYQENGLQVTIKDFEAGKLAVDALLAGNADIATAGEFVFITNLVDHPELRIFATVSDFRIDALVARKDFGISKPADLKGKNIGVLRKATSEFFLGRFLTLNGISMEEVNIVDLTPARIVDALLKGEIDAGQTWEPNVYQIKKNLGDRVVIWSGERNTLPPTETFVLIARNSWLGNRGSDAERFIRSLLQTQAMLKEDPVSSKAFIARQFNLKAEYVNYVYPKIDFKVELSQALLLAMEDETRWARDLKLIPAGIPNYLDFIHTDILEKVNSDAITMIH